MAWKSIGIKTVTNSATPVQVSTTHVLAHAVLIQAHPTNTDYCVVGSDNTVRAATPGGSLLGWVAAPSTDATSGNQVTAPSLNGGIPIEPGGIDLYDLWIDASTSGEAVIISYMEA